MESKKEHIKNLRLSEKSFVLFIQYPPEKGFSSYLIGANFLATQKRVAAL